MRCMATRTALLALADDALLAGCTVETFRASGPGGQHRNKTESAVRIRHRESGVTAQAYESRSQHDNRRLALERLRVTMALELREPVDPGAFEPPAELRAILPGAGAHRLRARNPAFWPGAAALLDLLDANGQALAETAGQLGLSTGQLSRLITSEPELLRAVNANRAAAGLHPLR